MVFNKNVDRKQIEDFENDILKKVTISHKFVFLKNELIRKKLIYKIEVQHSESDLKKYHSELSINIFNEYGDRVYEYDEPNCSLMFCETICFIHNGHIVGVDLLTDKDFIESLELLINRVKNTHKTIDVVGGTSMNYAMNEMLGNSLNAEGTMSQGITGEAPLWTIKFFRWLFV